MPVADPKYVGELMTTWHDKLGSWAARYPHRSKEDEALRRAQQAIGEAALLVAGIYLNGGGERGHSTPPSAT